MSVKFLIVLFVGMAVVAGGYYLMQGSPEKLLIDSGMMVDGYIVIGHEVRSFQACDSNEEAWISGDSPALSETIEVYNQMTTGIEPYTLIFGTLMGEYIEPVKDGFGADYKKAFRVDKLVALDLEGECPSNVTDTTNEAITCSVEQKQAEFCIEIYQPVCAEVKVQCVTTPCDPVKETFENSCKACANSLVETYTEGECQDSRN